MRMPEGPEMGAQFAQLVKELRSEYGGAVQACAFRISQVGQLALKVDAYLVQRKLLVA